MSNDFSEMAESAKADLLAVSIRRKLVWDDVSGDWFHYKCGFWQQVSPRVALRVIKKAVSKEMPDGYSLHTLKNMVSFLQIILVVKVWNTDKSLLPMKNGVLNLTTRELEKHDPAQMFRWCLPYDYRAEAQCPTIKTWLYEAAGHNQEEIDAIRGALNLAITGCGDTQKFMELVGPGGTGKSTYIRLAEGLVGAGNHVTTDLKNLESNRFETAVLYGKRVAFINDSSRYGGEVSILKAATGGDPLRMEKKNAQQGQSFVADCFIFIASNEPIQSADYSSGLNRRRVPVNFTRQVTEEDKTKWREQGGIEKVMRGELPGLLRWVLDMGRDKAIASLGGLNGARSKSQREHLIATNKLAAWLDDNCVFIEGEKTYTGSVPRKDSILDEHEADSKLYPNYYRWCADNGVNHLSVQRFGSVLNDLFTSILQAPVEHLKRDRVGHAFEGIAIRDSSHEELLTTVTREFLTDSQPEQREKLTDNSIYPHVLESSI